MNDELSNTSWSEYGRLVLTELERLHARQERVENTLVKLSNDISLVKQEIDQHRNVDERTFMDLASDIKDINTEFAKHVKDVNDVWSPKQMQQVKNEVYTQKNNWQKITGIVIAIQVIFGLLLVLLEKNII